MSLTMPNEIRAKMADLRRAYLNGCVLALYKTNHAPVATDTLSTYTAIEANFTGYARHTISEFSTSGFLNGSNNGEIDATNITFTCTGSGTPNTVYGYFIIDPTGTYCVAAELNPAGGSLLNTSGQTYVVALAWLVEQGT